MHNSPFKKIRICEKIYNYIPYYGRFFFNCYESFRIIRNGANKVAIHAISTFIFLLYIGLTILTEYS